MPAAQPLRVAAPGGAPDLPAGAVKEPPHLVLVTPGAAAPFDASAPADLRRQSFGQRLRAARERKGITLSQIAESTKVSLSLLAALERNDLSRWPKGIFRRSFFRDYVIAIGLPPEPLIAEFLQLFPDGEEHPAAAHTGETASSDTLRLTFAPAPGISRDRLRAVSIELVLVLLVAGVVVWWVGAGMFTGAAVIGLCYYDRLIAAVRSRRSRVSRHI